MNNPVMYSDPTGEVFGIDDLIAAATLGAIFNAFTQIVAGNVNGVGDFFIAAGIGALSGVAGAFAGSVVADAIKLGGFISGAASGAASGATSGFITGSGNAWMQGDGFVQGLKAGGMAACIGLGSGALLGGLTRGYLDYKQGYSFWDGSKTDEFVTGTISTNWDDITNQYNSSQRAEFDTELLKDRISDSFGVNEGEYNINKITTCSSSGYKITQTGEYVNLETNSLIGGYCRSFSSGYSELHISPFTTSADVITFKAVVGHELIHAYHHYIIPYNIFNKINSERVAYRYTYNVYLSNGQFSKAIGVREMAMGLNFWGHAPIFYNYYPFY